MSTTAWDTFDRINQRRRSVRHFDGRAVDDADMQAILQAAQLAPSSGNLQPYTLHWVKSPAQRTAMKAACNGQRAADAAGAFVVVVADVGAALAANDAYKAFVEGDAGFDAAARAFHARQHKTFGLFLRIAQLPLLTPFVWLASLVWPVLSLLPVHPRGVRHWCARSSIYAAQTLLLAAAARDVDACPMEGFDARKVAKLLALPRGAMVPVVVALGHAAADARAEKRWRRPFEDAVVVH